MRKGKWLLGAVGLGIAVWCASWIWDYFDHTSVAHLAIQYWLKALGSGVYEYHAKTGRWPAAIDDLAETSLPVTFPLWRETAKNVVFLWRNDLKDDSKDNGGVLLAYYNAGLFAKLGRVWVCWGDLRTEYMLERDLRARIGEVPGPSH
ncbi:MAG TPA: hypothetical protein VNX18_02250 [Bryobacteraceae bacterium]|jgi:hypothetical protein|nr:hypothetical protein [Bryobacteraceae bacterium]